MSTVALGCLGLLAYIWVGYPLLVRLLAGIVRRKASPGPSTPQRISVILATRDSDEVLFDRVRDIVASTYPKSHLEVVVAIDATRSPPLLHTPMPEVGVPVDVVAGDQPGGKAAALNAAVRAAKGDVLVFTDAGQRFAAETIPQLASALAANVRLGAVSGRLETRAGASVATLYWRYERWLREWEARFHSTVGVTGAVYAMHRALWIPLKAGLILDDLYVPMQLALRGYRIGFDPRALATDPRRFAARDEYRRKARTLTGVLQLCAWMPAVILPRRNPIWFQFVSHKLLRLLTPYLLLVLFLTAIPWNSLAVPSGASGNILVLALGAICAAALLSRRIRDVAWGVVLMQAAVVKATFNAVRGDWDVWSS